MQERKRLLCPLLHPRLQKSRDKSSYYYAPHNIFLAIRKRIRFSKQSVNGANVNWFKAA